MFWVPIMLAAALGPGPTNDDGTSRVVILGPSVDGELQDSRATELGDALRDGLSRGEFEVVPPPTDLGCAPPKHGKWPTACAAEGARKVGADYAVVLSIAVDRRDYELGLEVIGADTGAITASSAERCEVCGIAEAKSVVESQAAAIRARIDAVTLAPPVVVFESMPPGAVIRLDGKLVGETPFERVVEPGAHEIEATLHGHVAETQRLDAVTGVRSTATFNLEPVPRTVRFKKLRIFGWTALGIGVAGIVTGATLVAIDGRPNQLDCDGSNVDPDGDCKFVYGTLGGGIGALVAGGAFLATGIGILVGTRDKQAKGSRRNASLEVGPRYVGLRGRF